MNCKRFNKVFGIKHHDAEMHVDVPKGEREVYRGPIRKVRIEKGQVIIQLRWCARYYLHLRKWYFINMRDFRFPASTPAAFTDDGDSVSFTVTPCISIVIKRGKADKLRRNKVMPLGSMK